MSRGRGDVYKRQDNYEYRERAEKYWNKAEEYEAELNVGVSAERTEDGAVAEDSVSH